MSRDSAPYHALELQQAFQQGNIRVIKQGILAVCLPDLPALRTNEIVFRATLNHNFTLACASGHIEVIQFLQSLEVESSSHSTHF